MKNDRHGSGMRLTEFHPGHLFWMPRGATWLNRDKPRPFVLATRCRTGGRGTLIYGSTRNTEARMGAASVQVGPQPAGVNRNGLRERTHFYPGILVRDRCEVLPSHSGSVGRYLEALRIALYRALGIGKGSCLSPGAPAGSRRGRIVRLKGRLAVAMRTPFAVLLTEAWYSREQHYHAILPLVSGAGESVGPHVLRVEARGWMAVFPQPPRSVFLPISVVHSVWYDRDIAHETDQVLDDATLTEIDQRLCAYFSLPYDAPEG